MKSFLLSVRQPARSGASMSPLTRDGVAGVRPSQSHPRLMTLPNVLIAMPSRSILDARASARDVRGGDGRRNAPAAEADRDGDAIGARRGRARQHLAVDLEGDPARVVTAEQLVEGRIEQRLEVAADRFVKVAGVEERRQRIRQAESHRRAARSSQARRRNPLPRRAIARRQVPPRRDVRRAAPRFGHDLARDEQPELDADAGEANPLAARLRARRHVVIPRQIPSLHPAPIVDDRERRVGGARLEADACRARVERVGDDLGEDRLFERAGVGVAEVFEQVLEVDAGFAHGGFYRTPSIRWYKSPSPPRTLSARRMTSQIYVGGCPRMHLSEDVVTRLGRTPAGVTQADWRDLSAVTAERVKRSRSGPRRRRR